VRRPDKIELLFLGMAAIGLIIVAATLIWAQVS
jgi:hypothetical protein